MTNGTSEKNRNFVATSNKAKDWMHQSFPNDSKISNMSMYTHFASSYSQKWVILKLLYLKLSKKGLRKTPNMENFSTFQH